MVMVNGGVGQPSPKFCVAIAVYVPAGKLGRSPGKPLREDKTLISISVPSLYLISFPGSGFEPTYHRKI